MDNYNKVVDESEELSDSQEGGEKQSMRERISEYLEGVKTYFSDNLPIILTHNNDCLDDEAFKGY